jgi:glycosyltransferase involved in cell wall biosynthesis
VTFLTLRHWDRGEDPRVAGAEVVALGPRMAVHEGQGRRSIGPPLVFGACVLGHLLRHGRDYDVVHTASFPYFSVLAAGLARRRGGYRVCVDWHEVWTRGYWHEYLGALGPVGWLVQRLCLAVPQRAFCFSRLHEARLRDEGFRGPVTRLEGEYAGPSGPADERPAEPWVVFAGRHIPEKRVTALPAAVARARRDVPALGAQVFGAGPLTGALRDAVAAAGLDDAIAIRGFVADAAVDAALGRALAMVLPSKREGYGLIVVEAAARGTPSVVVAGPENAATELVEDGVNGVIAASAGAEDLGAAIVRVARGGPGLRASTRDWYARNARRLSIEGSLEAVAAAYAR